MKNRMTRAALHLALTAILIVGTTGCINSEPEPHPTVTVTVEPSPEPTDEPTIPVEPSSQPTGGVAGEASGAPGGSR